ncbi:hypothetical protein IJ096_00295 [Candidatus Saccharibacteria bacterium]|nr:hypothetical protein [Candidatus Saccharibacteria bacterium]
MAIDPNNLGSVVTSDTVTVNVGTNNPSGYTLSLSSNSSENALLKDGTSTTYTIPTLSSPTTSTTWASDNNLNNKWGFTHNNTDLLPTNTYLGVPASTTSGTTIKSTTSPANTSETNVTFATKIDETQPAGSYENTVVLSAVANIAPLPSMQEFSVSDCEALAQWSSDGVTGDTVMLSDARDGESYPIRRLADGNCWTVSNLRLTADSLSSHGHSNLLTSNDTDINSGSFAMPPNTTWSDSSVTTNGALGADIAPVADTSTINTDIIKARGAYYTWCTATADCSTAAATGATQPNSICPKGWSLPHSDGRSVMGGENGTSNYFQRLYGNSTTGYNSNRIFFDTAFHFYYGDNNKVFAGMYVVDWRIVGDGSDGYWWADTARDWGESEAALLLEYAKAQIALGRTDNRSKGFSVRCLLSTE